MAEKDSTLVLKVDLGCPRCCKKIKEILDKFHEIREKKYDEKKNTVTITGPFCPYKLKKKLLCRAGCIIICIECPPRPPERPPPQPPTQVNITVAVCCIHCGHGGGPCHQPQCCQGHGKPPTCKDHEKAKPQCCQGHEKPPTCKDHEKAKPPPCYPPCYCDYGPPCENLKKRPPCYCDYRRPPCYCGCGGTMGYDSTCKFYIEEDQQPCVIM